MSFYQQTRRVELRTPLASHRIVAWSRSGTGRRRFLLLHGNPGSMLDLAGLLEPLLVDGDVATFDAPGFGRSDRPDGDRPDSDRPDSELAFDIDAMADVAVAMLDHLEWNDAVLIGHSHGGGVAQRVARRHPDRLEALVLLGTLGIAPHLTYRLFPQPGVETLLAMAGQLLPALPSAVGVPLVRAFMNATYAPLRASEEQVAEEHALLVDRPHILRNMALVTRGNPCARLASGAPRISVPTLFLHGTADPVVPIRYAEVTHARMRSGSTRFVPLEGLGHMLALEAPERCTEEIRGFVRG